MATIDKSLPNTKTEIEIPGQEEIIETQQEIVENANDELPNFTKNRMQLALEDLTQHLRKVIENGGNYCD